MKTDYLKLGPVASPPRPHIGHVPLPTILYKHIKMFRLNLQGVPQLSSHFVSVILSASTHPNCKSWGSFTKFRKFATK